MPDLNSQNFWWGPFNPAGWNGPPNDPLNPLNRPPELRGGVFSLSKAEVERLDFDKLDTETILLLVAIYGIGIMDEQIKAKAKELDDKNRRVEKLMELKTLLNEAKTSFPADAGSDDAVGGNEAYRDQKYKLEKRINDLARDLGINLGFAKEEDNKDVKEMMHSGLGDLDRVGLCSDGSSLTTGIRPGARQKDVLAALDRVTQAIESANSTNQTEQMKLQRLTNLRQEWFEHGSKAIRDKQETSRSILRG